MPFYEKMCYVADYSKKIVGETFTCFQNGEETLKSNYMDNIRHSQINADVYRAVFVRKSGSQWECTKLVCHFCTFQEGGGERQAGHISPPLLSFLSPFLSPSLIMNNIAKAQIIHFFFIFY